MLRSIALALSAILSIGCAATKQSSSQSQGSAVAHNELEGVYEFVSETSALTKPGKSNSQRTSADWKGIWQFQSGYYSRLMMKKEGRSALCYPLKDSFGYDSSAGTYQAGSNGINLSEEFTACALNAGRSESLEYHLDGDTLTLTRTLSPYMEDMREGTITTVLHRIK